MLGAYKAHAAALLLLVLCTYAVPALSQAPDDPNPNSSPTGQPVKTHNSKTLPGHIIVLKDAPVVSYSGGNAAAMDATAVTAQSTRPKLDVTSQAVVQYSSFLQAQATAVAARVGIATKNILYRYTYTVAGFAVKSLSVEQQLSLLKDASVAFVAPNRVVRKQTLSTPKFLGLAGNARNGNGGVWSRQFKSTFRAGEGVVIGVLDTGIWPEHPSFYDRVGANRTGAFAYTQISKQQYSGICKPGEEFTPAQQCKDADGHGSHTAATAAGNFGVQFMSGADGAALSGMAPKARIAAYKALWKDGDSAAGSTADIVAAVEMAVGQGVDVINYSAGGEDTLLPDLVALAFMRAAQAGVVVATAAGNEGPAASSVFNAYPWIITVAASTHNRQMRMQASVRMGNNATYSGVGFFSSTGKRTGLILANNAALNGVNLTKAQLCYGATLDPVKVRGNIVVCDRGENARVDKSAAVRAAGGVGMILLNVATRDPLLSNLPGDVHSVPTVHLEARHRSAVRAYAAAAAGATATLIGAAADTLMNNTAPLVASFSSRGPDKLSKGALLKPDLTAPGVNIIAATVPLQTPLDPASTVVPFAMYNGTSMSTPHVAGLAALLKQKYPTWSAMAIKSALMTTAYQTTQTGAKGIPIGKNPFEYGAGHVNPADMFNPGLVFDSTYEDWAYWVCAVKNVDDDSLPTDLVNYCDKCARADPPAACDPANLNSPSVALPSLITGQTKAVVRTVTNVLSTQATFTGAWSADADAGSCLQVASIEPATFTLAPGQKQQLTITFDPFDVPATPGYVFGALTWTSDQGTATRIPVAANISNLAAPEEVLITVSKDLQNITYRFNAGFTGTMQLQQSGLVQSTVFGSKVSTGDAVSWNVTIPQGIKIARFAMFDMDVKQKVQYFLNDLDLYVSYNGKELGKSVGYSTAESVTLANPQPGVYTVTVQGYSVVYNPDFYMHVFQLSDKAEPNMVLHPTGNIAVTKNAPVDVTISVIGLNFTGTPSPKYLGSVTYLRDGKPIGSTLVSVEESW